MAAKPEINKGELAVLLFWLVPDVRNSRPTAGRIATDVLDNPHHEEIVRVVNLGLMDVDPTLHRFSPGAAVRRGLGLRVALRTLARFGAGSCAGPGGGSGGEHLRRRVGLRPAGGPGGLPGRAPLSGTDAVEILRRSVKLLSGS